MMSSDNSDSNSKVTREQYLYLAKLAEQAERYDEMVQFMRSFILIPAPPPSSDLSVEERTLFSTAVKNVVASHRAAWRIVSAILKKDPTPIAADYRRRIEVDLAAFCHDVLRLLDFILLPSAVSVESKVFFLKMKGDYNRYLAEFLSDHEKTAAADETMLAYSAAHKLATAELSPTHPIRLGLSLNFSVFYYEILEDSDKACNIAKKAFEEANEEVENGVEEVQKDGNLIMQLLWDNLTLWTKEEQEKLDDSEKLE